MSHPSVAPEAQVRPPAMSRAPKAVDGLSFTADDLVAMRGANEAAKAARAARGGDLV